MGVKRSLREFKRDTGRVAVRTGDAPHLFDGSNVPAAR
jgi:hypothetical protein